MTVIGLMFTLAIIGFIAYLITTFIPMAPVFRAIIYGILVITAIYYFIQATTTGLKLPTLHFSTLLLPSFMPH